MALSMARPLSQLPRAARQSSMIFSQIRQVSTVPKFQPSQSAELDETLEYFRQNLFIPFALPKRQRHTVFQTRNRKRLLDDPISMTINENEEYTLRPIVLEEVRRKDKISGALNMMIAANDFQNFGPFVRGIYNSGVRIDSNQWQKLIRKMGEAGQLNVLLGCARQQPEIGVDLQQVDILERLFYEFRLMAAKGDFKGEQVEKSLSLAKQAVDLTEFYGIHNLEATADKPTKLPASEPFVIATLLELSAASAIDGNGGNDKNNETLNYVRKLLANWDHADFKPYSKGSDINQWLGRAVTIANGLKLSLSVKDLAQDKALNGQVKNVFNQTKNALAKELKGELPEKGINYHGKIDLALAKKLVS